MIGLQNYTRKILQSFHPKNPNSDNNNSMSTNQIVSKVWSFCNTLRDDGVGYGDYLEQLTYLLFLKMADEYTRAPYNRTMPIPAAYNWQSLTPLRGAELEVHYATTLRELGKECLNQDFQNFRMNRMRKR